MSKAAKSAAAQRVRTPDTTTPVRLSEEAIKWARIASGYTGENMKEYVSRIVVERGSADVDKLHGETKRPGAAAPKAKG